jgi:hypothetical protein
MGNTGNFFVSDLKAKREKKFCKVTIKIPYCSLFTSCKIAGAVLVAKARWTDTAAQILHQEVQGPLLLHQSTFLQKIDK